jgi:hypothetical protein
MVKEMGSYELVEKVMMDCYGGILGEYDEEVINDFYNSFEKGEDISWEDYNEFCSKYIDDSSEYYYIKLNWKFIVSGGDESVYDENGGDEDENEDDDF